MIGRGEMGVREDWRLSLWRYYLLIGVVISDEGEVRDYYKMVVEVVVMVIVVVLRVV